MHAMHNPELKQMTRNIIYRVYKKVNRLKFKSAANYCINLTTLTASN